MKNPKHEGQEFIVEKVLNEPERERKSSPRESSEANEPTVLQSTHAEVVNLRREMQRLKQKQDAMGRHGFKEEKAKTTIQLVNPVDFPISSMSLGEFLATLVDAQKLILKAAIFFLLVGVLYILIAEPVYRVDALVDTGMRMDLLGDISKDLTENNVPGEAAVNEEIEILQSRKLLGKVVDDQNLDIVVNPVYFPIVGTAVARINTRIKSVLGPQYDPDLPLVNMDEFAWSNEQIKIKTFDVPSEYFNKVFTVVVKDNDQYQLLDEDGSLLTEGSVGVPNNNWLPDGSPSDLLVSKIVTANAGARFALIKIPRIDAINRLREFLTVAEKGLGSGVVQISLEGADKYKITAVANKIVNTLVQQEKDSKSERVQQSLDFMESQIPMLKAQEERAENALKQYRSRHGAVDLSRETQMIMERMVAVAAELSEFRRQRNEMLYKFTPQNPKILALDAHIAALNQEQKTLQGKVNTFPNTEQQVLRLTKDTELYSQLYASLRNQIGQLKLAQEAPGGYVGIVDLAVPTLEPVKPQKGIILGLALLLGLFSGTGAAFLRKALKSAIQDPEIIEKKLGLPVYATIPHSMEQQKLLKNREDTKQAVLAIAESTDPAIESVRSLRTSLHFVLLEAKNNVILVTGPTPGIGKSFLTVNFGAVLANIGKRVLIIDADLRKGQLNKKFGKESNEGLSDVIASGRPIEEVIRKTYVDKLDIICTGSAPPNPSELLAHDRFVAAVEKLSLLYDYVIIDSPPVLVVTDPAIIGRLAGAAMLVVKAGVNTLREVEQSAKRLEMAGVNLRGVVFNDMPLSNNPYGYGDYYGYAYTYAYKK